MANLKTKLFGVNTSVFEEVFVKAIIHNTLRYYKHGRTDIGL